MKALIQVFDPAMCCNIGVCGVEVPVGIERLAAFVHVAQPVPAHGGIRA